MFPKSTEIALRAVVFIAQNSTKGKKLGVSAIAKGINSSKSYTAKILQKLTVDNKIVNSLSGPGGGFYLTENSKKLPVRFVLEAMESEKVIEKCVLGLDQCSEEKPCPMHSDYKQIRLQLKTLFDSKTIQNLVDEIEKPYIF